MTWTQDDGLIDVTSAFQGLTHPINELYDDIHRRGWNVDKVHIKDGTYIAVGKSIHGEKLEATGRTDATAVGNLLVKVMRREHMRSSAVREKLGAWDHSFESQLAEIAQAYAEAPIYQPKAAPAWMDLAQDMARRAQVIRQQLVVEYSDNPTPYMTADEMREDVTRKKHIEVSRAYAHHPVWSEQQMLDYRLVVDVLGHTIGGADWGWHGTCLAFATLAPMVAESPQKALFTELVGQTAFGTVYRSWGPQKVAFLDELIEKAQNNQNGPGHTGIHPSQSIIPGQIPRIGKVAASSAWIPGQPGKGILTNDGQLHTWNIDKHGEPHHADYAADLGMYDGRVTNKELERDHTIFYIEPDGQVVGVPFGEQAGMIHARDRGLYFRRNSAILTAMAERTGNPELDAAIAQFMMLHHDELGNIQDFRHPMVAWGQCEQVAEACAEFLRSKGFHADASCDDLEAFGYQNAQPSESVMTPEGPAGDFTYPGHCAVAIYNERGVLWWTIDFTAAQYGFVDDFPKIEPGPPGPLIGPQRPTTSAILQRTQDPNANWESGIQPLPDNAYLWQRQEGVDPLQGMPLMDSLRQIEPGLSKMHPEIAKQAVVNALRGSLLGSRRNAKSHAIHYQTLHALPAHVDDPMAYWDAFEQAREGWNEATGYAPHAHKQFGPQELQFKQWIKALNPQLDDGAIQRLAKRELMHMLTEEEQRLVSQDPTEQLTTEQLEHEAYEALKKRLKVLTKPNVDQKVDFGDDHLFHEAADATIHHDGLRRSYQDGDSRADRHSDYGTGLGDARPDVRVESPQQRRTSGLGREIRRASPIRPTDLREYIAQHGPWAFRSEDSPEVRNQILQHPRGLLPWDDPDNPSTSPYLGTDLEPRPGHTYFGHPNLGNELWRRNMRDRGLAIDMRRLDPARINPDEDYWADERLRASDLPDPQYDTTHPLGVAAEEFGLGDNPDHTYDALQKNNIAYRGNIPPDALMPFDAWEAQFGPSSQTFSRHEATHHADMYPPYMHSHLRPLAQISRNATALADAAREDLLNHKGHGHHFRATALSLGIPEIGPRQASHAWLHLAPQTSQLGIINPGVMEMLGRNWDENSDRDYFRHERELIAGRDAAGYGHVPAGAFSAGLSDYYHGGPGWHPDRTPMRAYAPTPHHTMDWTANSPSYPGYAKPYWWESTQQARDDVAQDFDRTVGVGTPRSEVPFQRTAARRYYRWLPSTIRDDVLQNGMRPNPDTGNRMHFWDNLPQAHQYGEITNSVEPHDLWEVSGRPGRLQRDPWFKSVRYDDFGDNPGAWQSDADFIPPDRLRHLAAGSSPYGGSSPWVTHPVTGQRLTGAPGTSLMQHLKDSFGHPDVHSVWAQDYEVGKGLPGI